MGLSLLVWFGVGFIVAIKNVLIWDEFTRWSEEDKEELLYEFDERTVEIITTKKYMFFILTLCGFISLYGDFKDTFSRK